MSITNAISPTHIQQLSKKDQPKSTSKSPKAFKKPRSRTFGAMYVTISQQVSLAAS